MRNMARRGRAGVHLITRHGNDFTRRFPLAVAAISALPSRSFPIDGEAIVTNGDGIAVFELMHRERHGDKAVLCAFDLIELDREVSLLVHFLPRPPAASRCACSIEELDACFVVTASATAISASYPAVCTAPKHSKARGA